MGCACFEEDIDGYSTLLSKKNIRARKNHRCVECGKTIVPGELYRREVLAVDGGIDVEKTCFDCLSARDVLCCTWLYGCLWELIEESMWPYDDDRSIPWGKFSELSPAARDMVFGLIERRWE